MRLRSRKHAHEFATAELGLDEQAAALYAARLFPSPPANPREARPRTDTSPTTDVLRAYVRSIDPRLLTPAEELRLARRARAGDLEAKRILAERNVRLVINIARRYLGSGMDLVDLIQEGNLGLMHAIEKFDPDRGFKLSTYATWWIRQAITRAVHNKARLIRLPAHRETDLALIRRKQNRLLQQLGREPSLEELVEATGLNPETVAHLLAVTDPPTSLDLLIGDDEETTLAGVLSEATVSDDEQVAVLEMRAALEEALPRLPPVWQQVLRLRFGLEDGDPRTGGEVAKLLGVSKQRVAQIERKALERLRALRPGLRLHLDAA